MEDIDVDTDDDHEEHQPQPTSPCSPLNQETFSSEVDPTNTQQKSPDSSTSVLLQSNDAPSTPVKEAEPYRDQRRPDKAAVDLRRGDGEPRQTHIVPAGFRPGRLNHIEILERLFPYHKKAVLELVLQGCNSDLIKAIEHFLSAQDTIVAQQQVTLRQPFPPHMDNTTNGMQNGFNAYLMYQGVRSPLNMQAPSSALSGVRGDTKESSAKSAFTPLTPGYFGNLHSAFRPSGNQENLLNRKEFLGENPLLSPASVHQYHILPNQYSAQINSGLGPHFMMHPFRPWTLPGSVQELSSAVAPGRILEKTSSDSGRQTD